VVDIDKGRLIDLDPGVFGFNLAPVGAMPEALSASADGCWVASANRDSCDLGLVDPSLLLASLLSARPNPLPKMAVRDTRSAAHHLWASSQRFSKGDSLPPAKRCTGLCQTDKAPPALVTFPPVIWSPCSICRRGKSKIRSISVQPGSSQQHRAAMSGGLHAFLCFRRRRRD